MDQALQSRYTYTVYLLCSALLYKSVFVHCIEGEDDGIDDEQAEYEEQLAEIEAEEMEEEEEEEDEEEDTDAQERMRVALTERYEEENEAVNLLQVLYNYIYITKLFTQCTNCRTHLQSFKSLTKLSMPVVGSQLRSIP